MTEPRSVHQRIAEASEIIARSDFVKDGQVQGSKRYGYIPIAQILEAVRKAQAKAGVFVVFGRPEYDPDMREGRRDQSSGWIQANGHVHVVICGADGDSIETDIAFEVKDNSDKLTNLIYSNAMRNLYRTLYGIDEGKAEDDPESMNIESASTFEGTADEAVEEARRRANRAKLAEQAAQEGGFFSGKKPLAKLAKEVVETSRKSEINDGIKGRYATEYGPIDGWDRETMEACLAEMRGTSQ